MSIIEQRLDALERRVCRYRALTIALALALVAGVTMGQAPTSATFDEVICRTLAIVTEEGQIVAQLRSASGAGQLMIFNKKLVSNKMFGLVAEIAPSGMGGGSLQLRSATGDKVVDLYTMPGIQGDERGYGVIVLEGIGGSETKLDGSTIQCRWVKVVNDAGHEIVELGRGYSAKERENLRGCGMIQVRDELGHLTHAIGSRYTGGTIEVHNRTGEKIVTMYSDEYGNGVVGAWNRQGKGRTLTPAP